MGKPRGRKVGGKSRHGTLISKAEAYSGDHLDNPSGPGLIPVPRDDTTETTSSTSEGNRIFYFDRGTNNKNASFRPRFEEDWIPLKVGGGRTGKKRLERNESASEQDHIDDALESSSGSSEDASPADSSSVEESSTSSTSRSIEEEDEEFAQLVLEYNQLLYSPDHHGSLERALDENAAKLLRERKATDPLYRDMAQDHFDEIIDFGEIYGKRPHRGLQARLKRQEGRSASSSAQAARPDSRANRQVEYEEKVNFRQLNREIKQFVKNGGFGEEMELEAHPPLIRKLTHELAHLYGLDSHSKGNGPERHCILRKGASAHLPRDLKRLDRFIEGAQKAAKYAYKSSKRKDASRSLAKNTKDASSQPSSSRIKSGSVVGGEADPIKEDNVGSQMLRKLGWAPGQGLGSQKVGIKEPIAAVFKGNRTGLGS